MKIRGLLILSVLLVMNAGLAYAQSSRLKFTLNDIDAIKRQAAVILRENQRLDSQYQILKSEHQKLVNEISALQGNIKDLESQSQETIKRTEAKQKDIKNLQDELLNMHSDSLITETKNTNLKGELLDSDEQLNLWRLRLADLQNQKRQIEMEMNLKSKFTEEDQKKYIKSINKLQQRLEDSLIREKKLKQQVLEIEGQKGVYPYKADRMKEENKQLKREIKDLEKLLEFQKRKNASLKTKKMYAMRSLEDALWSQEQQMASLQNEVAELEIQLEVLNEAIDSSLDQQSEQRKLVNDVISLDKENRELKEQVTKLNKKIKELKKTSRL